eukprot:1152401-Pelagomonas_calceolata.AAC.4
MENALNTRSSHLHCAPLLTVPTCTGLFSATQTEAVQALARAGLCNSVRINVAVSEAPNQQVVAAPPEYAPLAYGDVINFQPLTSIHLINAACQPVNNWATCVIAGAPQKGNKYIPSETGAAAHEATQKTPTQLQITCTITELNERLPQLVQFLRVHAKAEKIIVYCLTCACVDFYALALTRLGPKLLPKVQVRKLVLSQQEHGIPSNDMTQSI